MKCKDDLTNAETLKLIHVNIRSIKKNWDEFVQTLAGSKIKWDCIVLSEINIKKYESILYKLSDYESYMVTRESTKRGGGVCMFVKNNIPVVFESITCEGNDGINAKFQIKNTDLQVLAFYRQPSSNKRKFVNELKNLIKNKQVCTNNVILVGDINIDILKKSKNKDRQVIEKYENMLAANGYEKKIDSPTRQEWLNGVLCKSCIDHIYIKSEDLIGKGYTWERKISDHYFIILTVKLHTRKEENLKVDVNEERLNDEAIISELKLVDWRFLNSVEDVNSAYDNVKNIVDDIYKRNTYVYRKGKNKETSFKTKWMTKSILEKITQKNDLWKRAIKPKDPSMLIEYKKVRNEVNSIVQKTKQSY